MMENMVDVYTILHKDYMIVCFVAFEFFAITPHHVVLSFGVCRRRLSPSIASLSINVSWF
jgi:hypothetical protein